MRGLGEVRGPGESPAAAERPAIALDLDDLYVTGEPVTLRARLVNTNRGRRDRCGRGSSQVAAPPAGVCGSG